MSWAAKMEQLVVNERVSVARERVEAEGKTWDRPSRFTEADLAKLEALRAQGRTMRETAVALKVPRSTVQRALAQKVGPHSTGGSLGPGPVSRVRPSSLFPGMAPKCYAGRMPTILPMNVDDLERHVEQALSGDRPADREPLLKIVKAEIADREMHHSHDRQSLARLAALKVKLEESLGIST